MKTITVLFFPKVEISSKIVQTVLQKQYEDTVYCPIKTKVNLKI